MKYDLRVAGRKLCAGIVAAALCAGSIVPGTALLAEEDGGAMGRYVESELALPEGAKVQDVVRMEDGRLRIVGLLYETDDSGEVTDCSYKLWDSADGGETWEIAAEFPEELSDAYFLNLALARDGSGAGIIIGKPGDDDDMNYYYVRFDAEGNAQEPVAVENSNLWRLIFVSDGELAGLTFGDGAWLLDAATGERTEQIAQTKAEFGAACGDEILLLGNKEVQRFSLSSREPLERDDALEKALFADGNSYEIMTTSSDPIVFAEDEDGRLCYATDEGIYTHTMGGSVVEQVVDGGLTSLADPSIGLVAMEAVGQSFYVLCLSGQESRLLKLEYDEEMPSAPQRELTVYSLRESSDIRQAVSQFQKQYPDTYVNYLVGLSGSDGVTVSDALRTLNTDILAGNGPDVLVMDGMNVDTYAEKGFLLDLRELAEEVSGTDGLLEQIAYTYESEGTLPAIPTKFGIPLFAGDPELIGAKTDRTGGEGADAAKTDGAGADGEGEAAEGSSGADGLARLEELAAVQDCLIPYNVVTIPELLYPLCAGSWKNENGTVNQDALAAYVSAVCRISQSFRESASEESLELLELFDSKEEELMSMLSEEGFDGDMAMNVLNLAEGGRKVGLGVLYGMTAYSGLSSVNLLNGACRIVPASGQQSNVFVPRGILGVTSTAKEQERALDFAAYLLSQDGQLANNYSGFPVNRTAFDRRLHEPTFRDGEMTASSSNNETGESVNLTYTWPTEEELDDLAAIVEELSVRAEDDAVVQAAVLEQTRLCIKGEISEEEAVNTIMQKINLYLAE